MSSDASPFYWSPILAGGIALAVATFVHLLGWHFWNKRALGTSLRKFRKIIVIIGTICFVASGGIWVAFSITTAFDSSWPHFWNVGIPLIRLGFWPSALSLLAAFFAKGRSRIFFFIASGLVCFFWFAAAMSA